MGRGRGRRESEDGKTDGQLRKEEVQDGDGRDGFGWRGRMSRRRDSIQGDDGIVSGSRNAARRVTSFADRLDRVGKWMDRWMDGAERVLGLLVLGRLDLFLRSWSRLIFRTEEAFRMKGETSSRSHEQV